MAGTLVGNLKHTDNSQSPKKSSNNEKSTETEYQILDELNDGLTKYC